MPRKSRKSSNRSNQIEPKNMAAKSVPPSDIVYNAVIYARLSPSAAAADTMANQIDIAKQYIASRHDMRLAGIYADVGVTGTNLNRPQFQRMMLALQEGDANCVVVKDMSRLGRDYIETGHLLENVLPSLGIRFIAIGDHYDSADSNAASDLTVPLKSIVNDAYAKDISRKVSAVIEAKQRRGEFIGNYAAYGYLKCPENKHRLVIDEEAAAIVREIFARRLQGQTPWQIAARLNGNGIPPPSKYRRNKGIGTKNAQIAEKWQLQSVKSILSNPVYIGCISQGKRRARLAQGQPMRRLEWGEWLNVPDMHAAIVSMEDFAAVNDLPMSF